MTLLAPSDRKHKVKSDLSSCQVWLPTATKSVPSRKKTILLPDEAGCVCNVWKFSTSQQESKSCCPPHPSQSPVIINSHFLSAVLKTIQINFWISRRLPQVLLRWPYLLCIKGICRVFSLCVQERSCGRCSATLRPSPSPGTPRGRCLPTPATTRTASMTTTGKRAPSSCSAFPTTPETVLRGRVEEGKTLQ